MTGTALSLIIKSISEVLLESEWSSPCRFLGTLCNSGACCSKSATSQMQTQKILKGSHANEESASLVAHKVVPSLISVDALPLHIVCVCVPVKDQS